MYFRPGASAITSQSSYNFTCVWRIINFPSAIRHTHVLGYKQERRKLAKKLGVDPYTTNLIPKPLDEIALVAFRAHVGVTTNMSVFIPGSIAITATRVVSQWVWDTPGRTSSHRVRKRLEEMKVPGQSIKAFMQSGFSAKDEVRARRDSSSYALAK